MMGLFVLDATPSSTAPAPPMGDSEEDMGADLQDLSSANAVIQQQHSQIQSLIQQQHQLQSQTSTLLAPALQVMAALFVDDDIHCLFPPRSGFDESAEFCEWGWAN